MFRPTRSFPTTRGGGFALLLTVLLLGLLIAVTAQVVTLTSTTSIVAARRHRALDHRLALGSTLVLLADELNDADARARLDRNLDRAGAAFRAYTVGEVRVACRLTDDAAKMNPVWLQRDDQRAALEGALRTLQAGLGLGSARIDVRPILEDRSETTDRRYRWFDQLLSDPAPGEWIAWDASDAADRLTWADAVTFWGDGRTAVRRVGEPVLEAALQDVRPGLARVILKARSQDRSVDFLGRALSAVDSEIRSRVARRLVFDARRYAVRVDTATGGDRRRWYVVAAFRDGVAEVFCRSSLTW